jgi:regulator of protease activity HflC (stomatin/prohibitin superfamily)
MSTSPEIRADDRIVHTISRWLARHISDDELRAELGRAQLDELGPDQAEALLELRDELDVATDRASLEMIARETMEAVALGG